MDINKLSRKIIGAATEVHKALRRSEQIRSVIQFSDGCYCFPSSQRKVIKKLNPSVLSVSAVNYYDFLASFNLCLACFF